MSKQKRFPLCLLAVFIFLSAAWTPQVYGYWAAELVLQVDNPQISLDGEYIENEDGDAPVLLNGDVYFPLGVIAEALEMQMEWISDTQFIVTDRIMGFEYPSHLHISVEMQAGSNTAMLTAKILPSATVYLDDFAEKADRQALIESIKALPYVQQIVYTYGYNLHLDLPGEDGKEYYNNLFSDILTITCNEENYLDLVAGLEEIKANNREVHTIRYIESQYEETAIEIPPPILYENKPYIRLDIFNLDYINALDNYAYEIELPWPIQ